MTVQLKDDLDGSEATETIRFGWDGREYEIDLNDKHSEAFRKAVAKYVDNARRVSTGRGNRTRPAKAVQADGVEWRKAVREWATEHGMQCPPRGRIPQAVVDAYNAS
jgi:hypothetical protein